ncbi:TolB family protein [Paenibacillus senegalimassiliensis]|uniref:TolB family protein n=1 Tax=Paenibacillus senegalimassiliensis TaxID=1737426 RepID=UPI00073F1874|nr:hypothetical protein [Paenibacillus senegalimassiliensis]
MKTITLTKALCMLTILLLAAGCNGASENGKVTIQEPGSSITIIDDEQGDAGEPGISVVKIDAYKEVEISDWLDENTLIVAKENESLEEMPLEELAGHHPRSLYKYNLATKEYTLLKEEPNLNLGGAKLSPDHKYLLYAGNSLGDPSYEVLELDSLNSFKISGENIGNVGSAYWADQDTIVGAGYMNGAYISDTKGKATSLSELGQEALFIVRKVKDTVYYNTSSDNTLQALNLTTRDITSLDLPNVGGLYPSPDQNKILVLQYNGAKQTLSLADADGSNLKKIAEGVELGGISWSPDQRMIAYSMKGEENGASVSGLYVHDLLAGESTSIAVDVTNALTCWSPTGEQLVYTWWDGEQYNSSIVYLKSSLQ